MKARLEDVLREKERELKLYQRFLNLRTFCEEKIFPGIDLPIRQHIAIIKEFIEKIIPEPKDRTEEMFSGEIFTLLGTLYLHDIQHVRDFPWAFNREILKAVDGDGKKIFMNYEIGRMLDIPDSAIEIINYLGYSNVVKKSPPDWEIVDNGAKAIVRNTKTLEYIFNFTHLLADLFASDISFLPLKRYKDPQIVLRPDVSTVDIDNKEGTITIRYNIKLPYEMHVLENVKRYVDNMFIRFKNNVNGRLGCQYRDIIWDITSGLSFDRDVFEKLRFSHYDEFGAAPFERWDEADKILDMLFNNGYAIVVGDASTGKTTVLKSFVMPQLAAFSSNILYCEIWSRPTNEVRDVIKRKLNIVGHSDLDIISLCKKLSDEMPCFIIIDSMERMTHIDKAEKEKFERFVEYCRGEENIYLIISGDRETFFEWHHILHGFDTAALYQLRSVKNGKMSDGSYDNSVKAGYLQTNRTLDEILEDLLSNLKEDFTFRSMMAFFVDRHENVISRYSFDEVYAGTLIPEETASAFTAILKEKDILRETESQGVIYHSLTNRDLKEPLYNVLKLGDFEARRKLRTIMKNCLVNEAFLDKELLTIVDTWKDHMTFRNDETGLILGSLIACGNEYGHFFEKARNDGKGIDIQPILRLITAQDTTIRADAIKLLTEIQDKAMTNPLLLRLKEESNFDIRSLIVKGISLTEKRKAILAAVNILREMSDEKLRMETVEFLHSRFGDDSRQMLLDIRDAENDQKIVKRINHLLSDAKPS